MYVCWLHILTSHSTFFFSLIFLIQFEKLKCSSTTTASSLEGSTLVYLTTTNNNKNHEEEEFNGIYLNMSEIFHQTN